MYATVRSYSAAGALVDALVARQDEVRSLIGGIDGFRAYYLIRTADGQAVTVSVFDDEAGAAESTRVATGWVAENLGDLGIGAPQVTTGEVAFSL
jgi:hypothetical protein